MRVSNFLEAGSKSWNSNLINQLFNPSIVGKILKTPLFDMVGGDQRVWWSETSSIFSVRCAYKLLMDGWMEL